MRTSAAGLSLIRRNEGCRLTAYLDTIADPPVFTIGYGCTGPDIHEGLTITQARADQMLADRLVREFEPGVLAALQGAPASQAQFDAMVSLAWNIGVGRFPDDPRGSAGFKGSSIARFHRARDYQAAANAFRLYNRAGGSVIPGLVRRREEERALYLSGLPAAAPITPAAPAASDPIVDAMKAVQTGLAAAGLYQGAIDADAGPMTRAALAEYRKQRGV